MSSGFLIKGRECPTTRAVPDETIANLTQGSPSHGHREENNSNGNKIDMTFPLIMIIIQFFILYFIHIKSNQIITRTLSHLSYSFNPNIISSDFSKLG